MASADLPYPTNDISVTLPSGTLVRVRNIVVLVGPQGKALTLHFQTPTEPADSTRVAREARELLEIYGASTALGPLARARVGVCRTQACLEFRGEPDEVFSFHRRADGSWETRPTPDQ